MQPPNSLCPDPALYSREVQSHKSMYPDDYITLPGIYFPCQCPFIRRREKLAAYHSEVSRVWGNPCLYKNYSLYITNARWKRRRNKRKNQTARYFRHIRTSTSPYKYPWSVSWLHVFRTKPWLFQPTHAVLRRNWRQYHNKIIFSWNLDYTLSSQRYNKEMKINAEWRKNII